MSDSSKKAARQYEYEAAGVRLTLMHGVSPIFYLENPMGTADKPTLSADLFHTHSWYEIFCALTHPITLYFEDHIYRLAIGEAIIIAPGKYHYAVFSDAEDKDYAFNFSVQHLHRTDTSNTLKTLLPQDNFRHFRMNDVCVHLVRFLASSLEAHNSILCGTYLLALLLNCAQCSDPSQLPAPDSAADNKASRIYKIEQAIFTNYTGQLPIKRLAEELHLSQRQVSRIIQQHYGASYRSKNKDLRMQAAARKLQKGMPIARVAAAEGYSSLSAFYTAFRKTFGMTPAQYQKQHKECTL